MGRKAILVSAASALIWLCLLGLFVHLSQLYTFESFQDGLHHDKDRLVLTADDSSPSLWFLQVYLIKYKYNKSIIFIGI